jgi:signal transduction histidine kinase
LLLPASLLDESQLTEGDARTPPRSLRDWLVDLAMLIAAVGIGALAFADTSSEHSTATAVLDIAVGVSACAALWVRRAHPVAVAVVVVSLSALSAAAAGAALVALLTVAVRCRPRTTLAIGALSVATSAIFPALYQKGAGYDLGSFAFGAAFTLVAVGWGLFVRARRVYVLSLHERARRLESEQRLRVEQARLAERSRIAREMHDVLAHRISLLSVHAGALEYRPDAPPDEISRAAGIIRATARTALQELREVIGLLRDSDENGAPEPPQPTLAHVPALIEESRRSGMQVRDTIEIDEAGDISDAIGRTVYRIVQEGLTNARKHAPGSLVDVRIGRDEAGGLDVQVISRPPVGAATPTSAAPALPGTGTGLIGLAERTTLAGGRLHHGAIPEGGYALRATIPMSV